MKVIFFVIVLLLSQSCLGGGADYYRDRVRPFLNELKPYYKPQVIDGVMEPKKFPDFEEDQKTLVGIDSNHDGVRDDMEIFINRNFKYDYEREIFKADYKRSTYFFANYKKMNCKELITQKSNYDEDLSCLSYVAGQLHLPISAETKDFISGGALYNTPMRETILTLISQKCLGMAYGDGYGDKTILSSCVKKLNEKYRSSK